MTVVSSFPLFNLPFVPLNEVFNCMAPVELICFSWISKKSKEMVKGKHILYLEITGTDDSSNQIVCKNQYGSTFMNHIIDHKSFKHKYNDFKLQKFDDVDVPMKLKNGYMITLWENRMEGIQHFISFLFNLFKIQMFSLNVYTMHEEDFFNIIAQFQKLKWQFSANILKFEIGARCLDDDIYICILEKFSDVPEINIKSSGTIYRHKNVQPESCCEIKNSKWLTLAMFNSYMKYKSIKLYQLSLTTREVNKFLKKWMGSPTMENVELTVKNGYIRFAIEGLPVTPQSKLLSIENRSPAQINCYEIQREDGVKANLWKWNNLLVMQTYQ